MIKHANVAASKVKMPNTRIKFKDATPAKILQNKQVRQLYDLKALSTSIKRRKM